MAPETPKGVSSRLLTMKFMQRAIASNSAAPSPESDSHSAKKRKLGHSSSADRFGMGFDQASVDAAMQAQEAQRQAALLQHATGDTHWVLNTKFEKSASSKPTKAPRRIVYVGYGDVDWDNDVGGQGDTAAHGRMSTQEKAKPKDKASQTSSDDGSGTEASGESDDESDDSEESTRRKRKESSSRHQTSRSRSKPGTRQTASEARAKELRDKRKKKEVRSDRITSISGAGINHQANKPMACYACHQPDHRIADCPRRKSGGRGR